MKKLVTEAGEFKYFNIIEVTDSSYICDGRELPKDQFGFSFTIVDEDPRFNILVPKSATPRQARLALLQANLLDEVELILFNDRAMQIWWEYSLEIERNHPHIISMGTALGLADAQLDELFIVAGSL